VRFCCFAFLFFSSIFFIDFLQMGTASLIIFLPYGFILIDYFYFYITLYKTKTKTKKMFINYLKLFIKKYKIFQGTKLVIPNEEWRMKIKGFSWLIIYDDWRMTNNLWWITNYEGRRKNEERRTKKEDCRLRGLAYECWILLKHVY